MEEILDWEGLMEFLRIEGFETPFRVNDVGFYHPDLARTYLPECIRNIEVLRLPYLQRQGSCRVYTFTTMDGQRGWISVAERGSSLEGEMVRHIERILDELNDW